jgi:ABC-type sugar transport system substrate-binding protein
MKKHKLIVALLLVSLLVAMAACQTKPTEAPVVEKPTAAPVATEKPAKKIVIGYSPPTLEMTDFYKFGQMGLEKKAAELGMNIEIVTKGPSTHSAAEEQLRIVEDFITQGVDYLWVVPVSAEAGDPMYKAAYAAKIPIFVGHALYDNPDALHIINVGTDFLKTGTAVGEWIAKNLTNCEGPVGIVRGAAGQYDTWRVESAKAALAAKCPNTVVYASDYTDWLTENALNQTKTMLTAHPDIKLIYGPASPLTMGIVQAIDEKGLTGKIKVVDYDFIPTIQKMCPEGKVVAGLAMFPFKYGEVVAQLINDLEAGKKVPSTNEVPGVVVGCSELSTVFPQWYLDLAK